MYSVRLETKTGEFVTDVEILALTPPPEVVYWGTRVFIFHKTEDGFHVYREGTMVPVFEKAKAGL